MTPHLSISLCYWLFESAFYVLTCNTMFVSFLINMNLQNIKHQVQTINLLESIEANKSLGSCQDKITKEKLITKILIHVK